MAGKTYGVSFALDGTISSSFKKSFDSANKYVGKLHERTRDYLQESKKTGQLVRLRKEAQELSKTYFKQKETLDSLNRAITETKKPTRAMLTAQAQAERQLNRTRLKLDQQKESVKKLNKELGAVGKSTSDLIKRQSSLDLAAQKQARWAKLAHDRAERLRREEAAKVAIAGSPASAVKGAAMSVGAYLSSNVPVAIAGAAARPTWSVLSGSVTTGRAVEKSMSRVYASDPKMSEAEKAKLNEGLRQISLARGKDRVATNEGGRVFLQAGFTSGEAIAAMPGVLDMAEAADINDLESAVKIQSAFLKSFRMDPSQSGRVADIVTNANLAGFADLAFVGDFLGGGVGKLANDARMTPEEFMAVASHLSDLNISGSEASTAFKSVLTRLQAPNKKGAELLNALGLKTIDDSGKTRPVFDMLAEINDKLGKAGLNEGEVLKFYKLVFEESGMAMAKYLSELASKGQLRESAKAYGELGISAKVAAMQLDNLDGDLATLSAAFQDLQNTIYDSVKGPLRDGTKLLTKGVRAAADFANKNPALTAGAAGAAGTATALSAAYGGVSVAHWLTGKGMDKGLFTGGRFAGALAFIKNLPIGRIVAIASVIAGAYFALSARKGNPEVEAHLANGGKLDDIQAYASGGVVTKPTLAMVGEGGEPEAIIPLSRWSEIVGGRGGGNVTVHFAPTITISGNGDAYADVKRGLSEGSANLKRELERLLADQRRLSFV